ncbi:MAG TPA: SemiSWEET transporter [Methanoregulaceae archaeon]|nr:SemiSWEET transporter [Methanoregulaceae archaeon]
MEPSALIGYVAGTCTTFSFLPQVFRTWKMGSCRELSWVMLLVFSLGVFLWFVYGLYIGEMPVVLANGITLVLVVILFIMKIWFTKKEGRDRE